MLKEDAEQEWAVEQVVWEVEQYKRNLERNRTQYNTSPVGNYLD